MATKTQKTTANGPETIEAALKTGTDAMKDGFEKAAKSYEQLVAFSKDTAEALLKAANTTGRGIETINSEVFSYSRHSVEESVAVTKAVLASKTLQEVLEIQSDYAKTAFETYVAEFTKVRDLAMSVAKAASEPVQARVAAFADFVQSAAA
jgi:phasin family protein